MKYLRVLYSIFFTCFIPAMIFTISNPLRSEELSKQQIVTPDAILLKSRQFTPAPGEDSSIQLHQQVSPKSRYHAILQFDRQPDKLMVQELSEDGVQFLHHIPHHAAAVSIPFDFSISDHSSVRWLGRFAPTDKIGRSLSVAMARRQGEQMPVVVEFYPDVQHDEISQVFTALGASQIQNPWLPEFIAVTHLSSIEIEHLAILDEVAWIIGASEDLALGLPVLYCPGGMTWLGPVPNYVVHDDGWDGPGTGSASLSYHFINGTPDIPGDDELPEITRGLTEWSKYVQVDWTETGTAGLARSMDILFASGDHGDGFPFDGPNDVLAHCFYPAPPNPETIGGDLHFDEDETWHIGSKYDMFTVALHECGHGLGLAHSENSDAVMYPYYSGPVNGLHQDDIDGIRSIYAYRLSDPWADGWAVGGNGVILKSTDWGETWMPQTSNTSAHLESGYFLNDNAGWVAGHQVILNTTNGGTTWTDNYSDGGSLNSVYFINSAIGWSVGTAGRIEKSTNGGDTWTQKTSGVSADLESVYFINSTIGWAAGGTVILKTTDGGTTWVDKYNGGAFINSIFFINNSTGWAVGTTGRIEKSTDGGETWVLQASGTSADLESVYFTNSTTGWAAGGQVILKTTNGGTTWTDTYNGGAALHSVFFIGENTGWAAGTTGSIVKTTNGGGTWVAKISGTSQTLKSLMFSDGGSVQHQLTMISNSGGYVTPSSSLYDAGEAITITAYEDPGYTFMFWSGGGDGSYTGTDNPAQITMNEPITQIADYIQSQYQLTMNTDPGGGVTPGSGLYDIGKAITITADPDQGYEFAGWTGSGEGSYTGMVNPATITMNAPILQTAHFQWADYTLAPTTNALAVPQYSTISVTFDFDIDIATVDGASFSVDGSSTGHHSGVYSYDAPAMTVTLDPDDNFVLGEVVTAVLTSEIQSSEGTPLYPYSWSFTTAVDTGYGTFTDQTIYSAGDGTHDIVAADLNNDGHLDLVAPNENVDNVSVFINNGDGTFAAHVTYAVSDLPLRVCAADLDHDGDLDLATANHFSHNVSVLLNNGDGTFGTQTVYAVGANPRSVCAADLDNDGDIDLAVPNQISSNVSILLNNGDATFAAQMTYPAGNETLYLAAGDMDSDGDVDLVTADFAANTVSVLSNNGNGTFGSPTAYPAGNRPYYVSMADLNADGHLDLAIPNSVSNDISILLNNGDGTLLPQVQYGAGVLPQSALASDLDGDGDLDLTVVNADADNVLILLNNSDGIFSTGPEYQVGNFPYSVCTADLDGDGDLDLAVANRDSDDISVLFNAPAPHILSTTPIPNALAISKFDAISVSFDTDIDMATVDSASFLVNGSLTGHHDGAFGFDIPTKTVTIDPDSHFTAGEVVTVTLTRDIHSTEGVRLPNSYSWSFNVDAVFGSAEYDPQVLYDAGDGAHSVYAGYLDEDDDIDLVVANPYLNNVMVYLNDGTGTLETPSTFATGSVPYAVCGGDLDKDGDIDLVTANNTSNDISILLNNGAGSFAPHLDYATGAQPRAVCVADMDGDGNMDVLAANDNSHSLSMFRGNGDGTLESQVTYSTGTNPWAVTAADLNDDGFIDAVTANTNSDDISVFLNDGKGGLLPAVSYPAGNEPRSVYAGDLDADGSLDLVTANDNGDDISVLINNGSAIFAPPISYPAAIRPTSVTGGDLDGDDDLDLVVTAADSDSIIVLLNDGAGIFTVDLMYQAGDSPHSVVAADLDNDDDLDLAVANWESDNLSVFLNKTTCDCVDFCDMDGTGGLNPVDVVYIVNFVYKQLDARPILPDCTAESGDWDCSESVNPVDVVYYVNYVYKATGSGPCDPCALQ